MRSMEPPEQQSPTESNIVPLGVTPLAKPDPFLEELSFIKLEGRYFCFDRREITKRRSGIFEYRDGNRGIVVEPHPRFGHPGPLAYKIVQSVFRKITDEGSPFPATVSFSKRELGRWVGRDVFGGRDSKDIYNAIRQLEDTRISVALYGASGEVLDNPHNFRFLIDSAFKGTGKDIHSINLQAMKLVVNPLIIESMRQNHFVVFNWERLANLAPLSAVLYKRLYLVFSTLYENAHDRNSLRFEKDYEDMCGEWLGGLVVEKYKSTIAKQLATHFNLLIEKGLLRSAVIEKRADGERYKIAFRPGKEFFVDYENFYKRPKARLLQFQLTADRFDIQKPLELVEYFYKQVHGVDTLETKIFSPKDTDFIAELVEKFGDDGVQDFIDYAVAEAPKTKYDMKTVHALKTYLPAWQADKEKRAGAQARKQAERQKQAEARTLSEYESFAKMETHHYLDSLSPEARSQLTSRASTFAELEHPNQPKDSPVYRISLRIIERKLIEEANPLPTFEEWKKNRN